MKNILVVFLYVLSGVAAHKEVHLVPAHIICPKVSKDHDILIPDPKDCSIYYKCEDGYPVPNTCPPGLLWCRVLKECTLPTLAKCTIGNTVVTYSPEDLATYKPKSKEPSETENICPVDNILLPNEQNCTLFNRCVNGTPTNENCPKGMSYSCWIGACVDAAISDCLNYGSQENKTCAVNGKKLPHPEDCHKYYECLNNKVETKTCSHNFEYNQWFMECYPHEKAHCQMHGVTPPTTTSKGTTVTPSPHEPICPKPDATFPNPTDCSSYFKCNKDYKPILFHCPDNLEYSCWDKECEAPVVAECIAIDIEVGESCKNNGQKMPDPKNCNKYYECEKYTIEEKSCDNGLHYNQWFEKCDSPELAHCSVHLTTTTSTITPAPTPTPSPTEDICPIDGAKIPNELYCYSYFVCENEIAVSYNCTDGLEYSCWDQTCLPPQSANCINKQNQTGQACSKTGQKMPNPKDCASYFECVDGIVEKKSCESDLLYNKYFQNCYKADLAHCNEISPTTSTPEHGESTTHSTAGPSNPPTTGTSTSATTSANTPSPTEDICPMEGAKIPNEVDCHSYYVCENEVAVSYTCADDEEYSCWDQTCLPPQSANCINKQNQTGQACSKTGQKMPNPKDCASYFECVDGIVEKKSCESDLLYNKYFQNCYKADLAHCNEISPTTSTPEHGESTTHSTAGPSNPPTTGTSTSATTSANTPSPTEDICPMEGAKIPNEVDCHSYYVCENEVAVSYTCADDEEYSCWDQTCLPPQSANCINKQNQTGQACSKTGQKMPNPKDCASYFECVDGIVEKKSCESDLLYNKYFQNCYKADLAHCNEISPTTSTPEHGESTTHSTAGPSNPPTTGTSTSATTSANTPSPTEDICPMEGAKIPNEVDCHSYYVCENEVAVSYTCADDEEYSCWDQTCLPPQSANCINKQNQTGQACSKTGQKMPNPKDCASYFECVDGIVEKKSCESDLLYNKYFQNCYKADLAHCNEISPTTSTPEHGESTTHSTAGPSNPPTTGTSTSATTSANTPSPTEDICPMEGAKIPNEVDCHSYYVCENEVAVSYTCADDEEYSCWDQTCLPPQSANCINKQNQTGQACSKTGQKMPNPKDCASYFECVDGIVEKKSCESDLLYNKYFQNCYKADLAHCNEISPTTSTPEHGESTTHSTAGPSNPPTTGTSTSTTTSANTPSPTEDICPMEGAKIPNEVDCHSYYVCENEVAVSYTCADDEEYSCWDQTCLPPQSANCINKQNQTGQACSKTGQKMPNPKDCASYFECVDGIVEKKSCESDLLYNKYFQNCYKADLAHCNEITPTTSTPEHGESTTHSTAGSSNPPTTGTSTSTTTSANTPSPTEDICPMEGAKIPNEVDCHSYYVCENEVAVSYTCADDEEYSCWDQTCLPPQSANCINKQNQTGQACSKTGQKMPNPKDCASYFECVDGIVEKKSCKSDLLYNKYFQNCYRADLAHCNEISPTTSTPEHGESTTHSTAGPSNPPTTGTSTSTTTSANTPSPTEDICPMEGAKIPNEVDCHSYYVCENEVAVSYTCADDEEYSCWDQTCLPPQSANCINKQNQTGQACSKTGQKMPNPKDCTSYFECVDGIVEQKSCESGLLYNKYFQNCYKADLAHCNEISSTTSTPEHSESTTHSTTGPSNPPTITVSPGLDNICPIPGAKLPDETDCHSYFVCENNKPVSHKCPFNLEYSCWDQVCLPASFATCANQGGQIGQPCNNEGEQLPNPADCNSYHKCVNGTVEVQVCASGTAYNMWFNTCVQLDRSHCNKYSTITPRTTIDVNDTTTIAENPINDICPIPNATLPNEADCSSFYRCIDETPILEYCPDNFDYSCWDQKCLPASEANCILIDTQNDKKCSHDGQKLPDIENCEKYYECNDGKAVSKNCKFGQGYNKWFEKCVFLLLSHCHTYSTKKSTTEPSSTVSITPGPIETCKENGETLPNPNNCSTYYKCVDNKPEIQLCAGGLEYSSWDKTCLLPSDANCITQGSQIGKKCKYNGQRLQNPDDCHTYYECKDNKIERKKCFLNWYYSKWFGICTPVELFAHCQTVTTITPPTVPPTTPPPIIFDDICPIADALLPNPMKCNAYYKCENEKAVAYDCPDGQGYSCWDQTCLPLSESHCIANETQVGMKCSKESARLQNVESCASYYECIKGTVQLKNCFIGFQYNKWYGKCVLPSFAHCKTSPVIPPHTTEVTPTSTNISFTPCTDSSKKIADTNNCKRYYECKNGKYEQRTCSDGLVWNCYTQTCSNKCFEPCCSNDPNASTYPHSSNCLLLGFKIPNPFTCNKYFECYRFSIVERTCSKDQTFDWLKSKCVKYSTGQCVPNIEDNTTTKLPFSTTNNGSDSTTSSTGTSSTSPTYPTKKPTTEPSSTVSITPGPIETCKENGETLPNPNNCSTYYKCVDNKPEIQLCAGGLEYSSWDKTCLLPADANCITQGSQIGKKCKYNGQRLQNPDDCHTYYECKDNKIERKKCFLNWYYSKWFGICTPVELFAHCQTVTTITPPTVPPTTPPPIIFDDICPIADALLPNPMKCNAYYKCENEKAVAYDCPDGQGYSCWDQTCLPLSESHCIANETQVGMKCSKESARLQNVESCASYYECIKGTVQLKNCFIGFQYNKWYGKCVLPIFAHCKTSPVIPPHTTEVTPTSTNISFTPCTDSSKKIADTNNCKRYYECKNGKYEQRTCSDGLVWNCYTQTCSNKCFEPCCSNDPNASTYPHSSNCLLLGFKIPNPFTCNKYFECYRFSIVERTCSKDQTFDWLKSKCVKDSTGQCVPNIEDNTTTKLPFSTTNNGSDSTTSSTGTSSPGTSSPGTSSPGTNSPGTNSTGISNTRTSSTGYTTTSEKSTSTSTTSEKSTSTTSTTSEKPTTRTSTPTSTTTRSPSPLCPPSNNTIRYPAPSDCFGYFECQNRQLVKVKCPTGENYNCQKKICEHQDVIHCCSAPTTTTTTTKAIPIV